MKFSVAAFALMLIVSVAAARFASDRLVAPAPRHIGSPPERLDAKAVTFNHSNGVSIEGWYARKENTRGAVVLAHPVRGSRTNMVGRARFLAEAGYSVMLIDLQGHGESDGSEITFGHLESLDIAAAVRFLRAEQPDAPVFVVGWSLGGAAALLANPPLPVDGMVLEAVYPSIERAIGNRFEMRLGAFGRRISPFAIRVLSAFRETPLEALQPARGAGNMTVPVMIVAGEKDRRTTPEDTQTLFDAFDSTKHLWMVPDAGHVDLHAFARGDYEDRILKFLASISD